MDIQQLFRISQATRNNIRGILDNYSLEALNTIPAGYNNNLLWNAGHVVATSLILTYGLCDLEPPQGAELLPRFRKGTRPEGPYSTSDQGSILEQLEHSLKSIEQDFHQGIFTNFKPYATSYGVELHTIEEALAFNNVHESMHLGTMITMRELIG